MGIPPRALLIVACGGLASPVLGSDEVLLRMEVMYPAARVAEDGPELTRVEIEVEHGTVSVPVELDVVLDSRFERCGSHPEECDGRERSAARQCFDAADNDGDGRIDREDPDCVGVQGYTLAVATDASFHLRPNVGPEEVRGATFAGTASDDAIRPPGIAQPPLLRYVDIGDPARNGGQEGLVGACALSLQSYVILPPFGSSAILKVRGDLDPSGPRPGEKSAPCRIDIRGPGEEGLRGMGEPTTTQITVIGETFPHTVRDLEIVLAAVEPAPFKRGDGNSDGSLDISDALAILNHLFIGGRTPECLDSADADDSGELGIADGIAVLHFLFLGGEPLPMPGIGACGVDPTSDTIPCKMFSGC